MQIKTPDAIELGRKVHRTYGSWQKAREAADRTNDGTYRINRDDLVGNQEPHTTTG